MGFQDLIIGAQSQLFKLKRGMFQVAEQFYILVVFVCSLVFLAKCGSCLTYRLLIPEEYDACGSYKDNYDAGLKDIYSSDSTFNYVSGNPEMLSSAEDVCSNSKLFCFPSTLYGLLSEEHNPKTSVSDRQYTRWDSNFSRSSNYGVFQLLNGRSVSCSMHFGDVRYDMSPLNINHADQSCSSCREHLVYHEDANFSSKNNYKFKKSQFVGGSSIHVKVSPPQLDWGENYLYSPSLAFLTVKNTCNESFLNIYEPFSTNTQFYPCNFSEILLGPGEVASICFAFLPRWLGLSSAQIIVQTSSGGFLVQAKGLAIDSHYKINPLLEFDTSSSGWWSRNISLFNPFKETIHLEEVAASLSIFVGNASILAELICRKEDSDPSQDLGFYGAEEWLDVRSTRVGFPVMAVRPLSNWVIGSNTTETIMGLNFLPDLEGKVLGAICMRLQRPLQDKTDMVMIPLEAEINGKASYKNVAGLVSASVEVIGACDSDKTVISISVRNNASYLLRIVKVSEVTESRKLLQIKYSKGLLLFPGTLTQVALVTHGSLNYETDSLPERPNTMMNCRLQIWTNDSSDPQIEIPCLDIILVCPANQREPAVGYEYQPDNVEAGNRGRGISSGSKDYQILPKALEKAEADEFVLQNWRSQGMLSDLSVLDDHEVVFPMVPVGRRHSKLIHVKNPSQQPVIMQLILNSAEIVDNCKVPDGYLHPPSSSSFFHNDSTTPASYGFSIAERALTEAYVHPSGTASFGPILFHPSNRCRWKSSALVRNNLSGVEWLSLQGFGGLLSLVLLEGTEPVRRIEFNLNVPLPLNVYSSDLVLDYQDDIYGCHKPLSKLLLALNTGDLPVMVKRIDVSGTECGLDGFIIPNCEGFTVEPGKSKELQISYQTDLSAAIVQRDLELYLGTGILVIPMKASMSIYAHNLCRKAMFWERLKKCSFAIFLASLLMLVVFCFLVPHIMALGSLGYFIRGDNSIAVVTNSSKSLDVQHGCQNGECSVSTKMSSSLRSVEQEDVSIMRSVVQCPSGKFRASKHETKESIVYQRLVDAKSNAQNDLTIERSDKMEVSQAHIDSSEPSQPVNLTVRTRTDKGRRRRKRKGTGAGLSGLVEVSSSQSGNSTPSSPLSPVTAFVSRRTSPQTPDKEQSNEPNPVSNSSSSDVSVKCAGGDCSLSTSLEKPFAPSKMAGRPLLLPSATFPSMGRSAILCHSLSSPSRSIIAPLARAPGSKLSSNETVQIDDEARVKDEFTYDIWGKHFSGIHLKARSDEASLTGSFPLESESNSFFARGPQTLMTKSGPRSLSCIHRDG
ncbi:hypothetical protein Nepgr_008261 [Nepenthes gracilis]|uniref:Transmembrane protein 131-like N-terminal domain-containing protein n=1 Tax=Nepenthes gracilis TaxID=150966 RepID=A0AAD3XJA0_NEPGR|nr:hypothetical protein Nepgr_008261 [Nepenthes gracilis]